MQQRTLGKTGFHVSALTLGGGGSARCGVSRGDRWVFPLRHGCHPCLVRSRAVAIDYSITLVILMRMKTAISLPDPLFLSAERLAKRLKVSRSALYANAVAAYVVQHQKKSVTERLYEVYGEGEEDSTLDPIVAGLQWHSLAKDEG